MKLCKMVTHSKKGVFSRAHAINEAITVSEPLYMGVSKYICPNIEVSRIPTDSE